MTPAMNTHTELLAAYDLGYGPIVFLILFTMVVGVVMLLLTHFIPKPKRSGHEKDGTYEAGMEPVGDTRRRFNVRFYIVAMLFLLFDVELIFIYPWTQAFFDAKRAGNDPIATFLFVEMAIFFMILLVGYLYDLGKGVLRYD